MVYFELPLGFGLLVVNGNRKVVKRHFLSINHQDPNDYLKGKVLIRLKLARKFKIFFGATTVTTTIELNCSTLLLVLECF